MSSGSSRPPMPLTTSSRNSEPATAASSRRSLAAGVRRESRWLTTSRTLSGLPISASGRPSRIAPYVELDGAGLDQRAPELADEERVPLGEAVDRLCELAQLRAGIASGGAADELGDLVAGEPREPQPDDVVGAAEIGERLGERLRHVRLGVAEGREQENPHVSGGTGEVPEQEQRRSIGPVAVLEHEQRRSPERDGGEEIRHRRVKPVALGIRIRPDRSRELADPGRQVGEEACELPTRGSDRRPKLRCIRLARELVERLDERPVRGAHEGVARAVQDEDSVLRGLAGELAHEATLARTCRAADQRDSASLALGPRNQPAEQLELGRTPDEREGRAETKRPRKLVHGARPRR